MTHQVITSALFSDAGIYFTWVLMSQVLDEGCEGGVSGDEHAVAVQRVEEPLQTGRDRQPPCLFVVSKTFHQSN